MIQLTKRSRNVFTIDLHPKLMDVTCVRSWKTDYTGSSKYVKCLPFGSFFSVKRHKFYVFVLFFSKGLKSKDGYRLPRYDIANHHLVELSCVFCCEGVVRLKQLRIYN